VRQDLKEKLGYKDLEVLLDLKVTQGKQEIKVILAHREKLDLKEKRE
jgi:hypothetical protein